jgi:hypothetical protein
MGLENLQQMIAAKEKKIVGQKSGISPAEAIVKEAPKAKAEPEIKKNENGPFETTADQEQITIKKPPYPEWEKDMGEARQEEAKVKKMKEDKAEAGRSLKEIKKRKSAYEFAVKYLDMLLGRQKSEEGESLRNKYVPVGAKEIKGLKEPLKKGATFSDSEKTITKKNEAGAYETKAVIWTVNKISKDGRKITIVADNAGRDSYNLTVPELENEIEIGRLKLKSE